MVMHRIKKWLMDHPEVLSVLFLFASVAAAKIPEISTKSGSSAFRGP